jgi:hypothetical protein
MMKENEYHQRLNEIDEYFREIKSNVAEIFNEKCGVAGFGPHMIVNEGRMKELAEKSPKTWREAFNKFIESVKELEAIQTKEDQFGDGKIQGIGSESPVITFKREEIVKAVEKITGDKKW